jgi:hypothetical protein
MSKRLIYKKKEGGARVLITPNTALNSLETIRFKPTKFIETNDGRPIHEGAKNGSAPNWHNKHCEEAFELFWKWVGC